MDHMETRQTMDAEEGLGNRGMLDKIDKLRELGISDLVPLPQMVVVGDQSAGKSSVLESLTGFNFPRSVTLCTRHATEIVCRREETTSFTISIIPHDADPEREKLVKEFRRVVTNLKTHSLAQIFKDAAQVMGIRSTSDDTRAGSAFSKDVLRVEISGAKEHHLTVIDVPGMFENETPGLTTKSDIQLVKDMVNGYISESRTIILAVIPCTGDIANQKILTFAAEVDPEGKRTLGVLTKPDLAVENAMKEVVVDLVNGKRRDLQLGYCVVKNRGADDLTSSLKECRQTEEHFFARAPWTKLPHDRVGVDALRRRLRQLLMDRTKSEYPLVKSDLNAKLKENRRLIKSLGQPRRTTDQQRMFVGNIASRFMQLKNFGLDAYYTRDLVFVEKPELKLITRVREANELFSEVLHGKGHSRNFAPDNHVEKKDSDESDDGSPRAPEAPDTREALYDDKLKFAIPLLGEDELQDILSDPYRCPPPLADDIMDHIKEEYSTSRGYEMGTFSSEMLPTTFKEQCKKWRPLALGHVSNAILVVHHFIHSILEESCPDPNIRANLWEFLQDDLEKRCRRAMDHAKFLLEVEFEGKSITYNPIFDETLNITKLDWKRDANKNAGVKDSTDQLLDVQSVWHLVENMLRQKSSLEARCRDIHDVLFTFYKIARSRFVDVLCQQVIDHFLLHASDGPLAVLSDQVVLAASPDQLETIAGEDMATRGKRETLTREIDRLGEALKILKA